MKQVNTSWDEDLARTYKKTHNLSETARIVGVKYGFARARLTALGLHKTEKRNTPKRYDIDKECLQEMMDEGLTIAECARRIGVRDDVIRRFAEKHGMHIVKPRPQKYQNIDPDRATRLYLDDNMSLKEVADEFGVSENIMQHWFAKQGIKKDSKRVSEQRQRVMLAEHGVAFAIHDRNNLNKMKDGRRKSQEKKKQLKEEIHIKTLVDVIKGSAAWHDLQETKNKNENNITTLNNLASIEQQREVTPAELARLHLDEKMDWREINDRFHLSMYEIKKELLSVGVRYMKNIQKLSSVDTDLLCDDYQSGMSLNQLSKKHGISTGVVQAFLANKGFLDFRGKRVANRLNAEEKEEVVKSYLAGRPLAEIERKTNTPMCGLRFILEEAGIVPSDHRRKDDIMFQEIASKYAAGATVRELAQKYEVSAHAINERMALLGIKRTRVATSKYWNEADLFAELIRGGAEKLGRKVQISEIQELFGLSKCAIQHKVKECDLWDVVSSGKSTVEEMWNRFAKQLDSEAYGPTRLIIPPRELDIVLPTHKIALEINPTATHVVGRNIFAKDNNSEKIYDQYHLDKSDEALTAGYELVHIFDWDNEDKLLGYLSSLVRDQQDDSDERSMFTVLEYAMPKPVKAFLNQRSIYPFCKSPFGLRGTVEVQEAITNEQCLSSILMDEQGKIAACLIVALDEKASGHVVDACCREDVGFARSFARMVACIAEQEDLSHLTVSVRRSVNSGRFMEEIGFCKVGDTPITSCLGRMDANGEYVLDDEADEIDEPDKYGRVFDCGTVAYEMKL